MGNDVVLDLLLLTGENNLFFFTFDLDSSLQQQSEKN